MSLLPLLARELRLAARHWVTYYLRTLGVAGLLLAILVFYMHGDLARNQGGQLFMYLHLLLYWGIWVLIPVLVADSISRERREGTLGLLFLTGLKPSDIVAAKGLVHGFRALTLWLAVIPVGSIPFLLGGVDPKDAALSLVLTFGALCGALAAGLLASAWSKAWLRALLGSLVLALVLLTCCTTVSGLLLLPGIESLDAGNLRATANYSSFNQLRCGFAMGWDLLTSPDGTWYTVGFLPPNEFVWALVNLAAFSFLVLLFTLNLAGEHVRRVWQELPPSPWRMWQQKTFCTPILLRGFLHRRMKRKIELNPVGWLEHRSWSGRLVTWTWLGVIAILSIPAIAERGNPHSEGFAQFVIACLLAGSVALSAAGSFRRERESGVLELLLVSPMGAGAIVWGRLFGLWGKFLPAMTLLFATWWYLNTIFRNTSEDTVPLCIMAFLTVPVIGLHYSLRCVHFITAFLATLAVGLLGPFLLSAVLNWAYSFSQPDPSLYLERVRFSGNTAWVIQVVVAIIFWNRLVNNLRERSFPLERTES
jgi:ABC-type transport system involved in multi-copper enzyme maturation permease subunit